MHFSQFPTLPLLTHPVRTSPNFGGTGFLASLPIALVLFFGSSAFGEDLRKQDVQPVAAMVDGGLREAPQIEGRVIEGKARFPLPEGTRPLEFPNAEMQELEHDWPVGWNRPDPLQIALGASLFIERTGQVPKPAELAWAAGLPTGQYEFVVGRIRPLLQPTIWQQPPMEPLATLLKGEGPDQTNAIRITNRPGSILATPHFEVESEEPFLLSFWTRTDGSGMGVVWFDIGLDAIAVDYLAPPKTDGEWRRAGFYFRARQGAERATVYLTADKETTYIDVTGFEVRSATEEEYSRVYRSEREALPPNVTKPEPGDGANLTLSKAKLSGRHGVPGRPFVVWAIGSSWTNGLGRGEDLRQMVRAVYPDAPKIVYKGRFGSGTPYDYARGWGMTGVTADYPDLVISYTGGSPEALEKMLKWIRSNTTADIIIPSLHFTRPTPLTPEIIETEGYDVIREICEKYGAQFVENRRELAAWLEANDKADTPAELNSDMVHQNRLGSLLTNENIWRHLLAPIPDDAKIESEQIIDLATALREGNPKVTFSGDWEEKDGLVVSKSKDAAIKVTFAGNRLDVVGEARPDGGELTATINGSPARDLPAFAVSLLRAPDTNVGHGGQYPRSSEGAGATGPHGVTLGENVVPQDWRIEMIDTQGGFRLIGSKTGLDGTGRSTEPFVSTSGQIKMEPDLWRHATTNEGDFRNQPGDHWTFEVSKAVVNGETPNQAGKISFRAEEPTPVDERVFFLAPRSQYEVLLAASGGPIALRSLVLYTPPIEP